MALTRALGVDRSRPVHLFAALFAILVAAAVPLRAENWPASVRVLYDINFNGLNIGTFEFQSQAEHHSYTVTGSARLSILLGAFTWNGQTRSFGLLFNEGPKPAAFTFDYKSTLTAGSTKMDFADGSVTDVIRLPPAPERADAVPVREQHLKGVLDPLSAMLAIARGSSGNPCERRVPIFDGKERFDLTFSYKGQTKVGAGKSQADAPTGFAYVCRVRYQPIAGHKIDSTTRFMAANENIEVAMLPIPAANVFVPYQVTIPLLTGSATLVSKKVDITSPGKPEIALTR